MSYIGFHLINVKVETILAKRDANGKKWVESVTKL
jgi:hypothetical protein